jgi:hypothetical protein
MTLVESELSDARNVIGISESQVSEAQLLKLTGRIVHSALADRDS